MLENSGPNCPLASSEHYTKHLNFLNEYLFQRPMTKKKFVHKFSVLKTFGMTTWWWENAHLEISWKTILKDAKLSKTYTIHSIRATAVAILHRSGFEARQAGFEERMQYSKLLWYRHVYEEINVIVIVNRVRSCWPGITWPQTPSTVPSLRKTLSCKTPTQKIQKHLVFTTVPWIFFSESTIII